MAGRRSKKSRFQSIKLGSAFAAGLALLASSLVFSPPAQAALINGCNPSASPFGAGAGDDPSDPYLICSRTQLKAVETSLSSHYRLASNLNLTGTPWAPIQGIFTGTFDGDFKSISDIHVTQAAPSVTIGSLNFVSSALFAALGSGSVVQNLRLDARIENSSVTAGIGNGNAGALAGAAVGATVTNIAVSSVNITGYHGMFGGLVGYAERSTFDTVRITNLDILPPVTAGVTATFGSELRIGGLIGQVGNAAVSISRASVSGIIRNSGDSNSQSLAGYSRGGVIGELLSLIQLSQVESLVVLETETRNTRSGGFVGRVASPGSVDISNSIRLGSIQAAGPPGGTLGGGGGTGTSRDNPKISNTIVSASVSATNRGPWTLTAVANFGDVSQSFYDSSAYGPYGSTDTQNGVVGKTSADLKRLATYADSSWKIALAGSPAVTTDWSLAGVADSPNLGDNPIWKITEDETFPQLVWLDFFGAQFLSYGASEFTIHPKERTVARLLVDSSDYTFSLSGAPQGLTINSGGTIESDPFEAGAGPFNFSVIVTNKATGIPTSISITLKISDGNLPFTVTPLDGSKGPRVGDEVYASAFERYLSTEILASGPAVDEYVYRLTTAEIVDTSDIDRSTFVDYQSDEDYTPLDAAQQTQWYVDNNYPNYEFNWRAFLCVDANGEIERPTQAAVNYISVEEIFTGSLIDPDDNADFRGLISNFAAQSSGLLTIVGEQNATLLGEWRDGPAPFPAYGASKITGSCKADFDLKGLTITDAEGDSITTKSFEIGETLFVKNGQDTLSLASAGTTIGVTGGFDPYSAALFGLGTIQAAPQANTTPTYTGPTVTSATPAAPNTQVTLTGTNLATVTRIEIDGISIPITNATATQLTFTLPATITPGLKDLKIFSAQGTLTVQAALRVLSANGPETTQNTTQPRAWTKAQPDGLSIKVYARNIIGKGKIQFFVDGLEVAWARATDATDPKLRIQPDGPMAGTDYLVRTVDLNPGKNRIEIRLDGIRIWRATYLPKP